MNAWHYVELGDAIERHFRCVIEIPKGSKVKYELDKATGTYKVHTSGVRLDASSFGKKYDPGNPVNPTNQFNPNNPFNPANQYNPQNPLTPANKYNPNTPFEPLH